MYGKQKQYYLYTAEEKFQITQDHLNNCIGIRACATKNSISPTSLVYWLRALRDKGREGLESQIGKHRGPNKGRPIGTFKPKKPIEELEKENLKLKIAIE
jgi:transposase-like protein